MRKHIPLFLIVIALAASICLAYLAVVDEPYHAGLVVAPKEYALGEVSPEKLSREFRVINNSQHPVVLERVLTGCGCARVALPAKQLAPGESATGTCDLDVRGRRGRFVSFFRIVYREMAHDAAAQSAICVLTANVNASVGFDPPDIEFSPVTPGTIAVRIQSSQPGVRVTQVRADHRAFHAVLNEDGLAFTLTFEPSLWSDAEGRTSVEVETTSDTEKWIRLPISVRRQ